MRFSTRINGKPARSAKAALLILFVALSVGWVPDAQAKQLEFQEARVNSVTAAAEKTAVLFLVDESGGVSNGCKRAAEGSIPVDAALPDGETSHEIKAYNRDMEYRFTIAHFFATLFNVYYSQDWLEGGVGVERPSAPYLGVSFFASNYQPVIPLYPATDIRGDTDDIKNQENLKKFLNARMEKTPGAYPRNYDEWTCRTSYQKGITGAVQSLLELKKSVKEINRMVLVIITDGSFVGSDFVSGQTGSFTKWWEDGWDKGDKQGWDDVEFYSILLGRKNCRVLERGSRTGCPPGRDFDNPQMQASIGIRNDELRFWETFGRVNSKRSGIMVPAITALPQKEDYRDIQNGEDIIELSGVLQGLMPAAQGNMQAGWFLPDPLPAGEPAGSAQIPLAAETSAASPSPSSLQPTSEGKYYPTVTPSPSPTASIPVNRGENNPANDNLNDPVITQPIRKNVDLDASQKNVILVAVYSNLKPKYNDKAMNLTIEEAYKKQSAYKTLCEDKYFSMESGDGLTGAVWFSCQIEIIGDTACPAGITTGKMEGSPARLGNVAYYWLVQHDNSMDPRLVTSSIKYYDRTGSLGTEEGKKPDQVIDLTKHPSINISVDLINVNAPQCYTVVLDLHKAEDSPISDKGKLIQCDSSENSKKLCQRRTFENGHQFSFDFDIPAEGKYILTQHLLWGNIADAQTLIEAKNTNSPYEFTASYDPKINWSGVTARLKGSGAEEMVELTVPFRYAPESNPFEPLFGLYPLDFTSLKDADARMPRIDGCFIPFPSVMEGFVKTGMPTTNGTDRAYTLQIKTNKIVGPPCGYTHLCWRKSAAVDQFECQEIHGVSNIVNKLSQAAEGNGAPAENLVLNPTSVAATNGAMAFIAPSASPKTLESAGDSSGIDPGKPYIIFGLVLAGVVIVILFIIPIVRNRNKSRGTGRTAQPDALSGKDDSDGTA